MEYKKIGNQIIWDFSKDNNSIAVYQDSDGKFKTASSKHFTGIYVFKVNPDEEKYGPINIRFDKEKNTYVAQVNGITRSLKEVRLSEGDELLPNRRVAYERNITEIGKRPYFIIEKKILHNLTDDARKSLDFDILFTNSLDYILDDYNNEGNCKTIDDLKHCLKLNLDGYKIHDTYSLYSSRRIRDIVNSEEYSL